MLGWARATVRLPAIQSVDHAGSIKDRDDPPHRDGPGAQGPRLLPAAIDDGRRWATVSLTAIEDQIDRVAELI